MQEMRVWSMGWEDPLEKEMATCSSVLAWRIPWREEPGCLHSTGSHRVERNWAPSRTIGILICFGSWHQDTANTLWVLNNYLLHAWIRICKNTNTLFSMAAAQRMNLEKFRSEKIILILIFPWFLIRTLLSFWPWSCLNVKCIQEIKDILVTLGF